MKQTGTKLPNGQKVEEASGNVFGNGVYTTKIPLYAQCNAEPVKWKNY